MDIVSVVHKASSKNIIWGVGGKITVIRPSAHILHSKFTIIYRGTTDGNNLKTNGKKFPQLKTYSRNHHEKAEGGNWRYSTAETTP